MALGINPSAIKGVGSPDLLAALDAASQEADGYLGAQYTLPLLAWGKDLRKYVSQLAAYDILATRGRNPQGLDEDVRMRRDDAIRWLKDVRAGVITPAGIVDSTPNQVAGTPGFEPVVVSSTSRG